MNGTWKIENDLRRFKDGSRSIKSEFGKRFDEEIEVLEIYEKIAAQCWLVIKNLRSNFISEDLAKNKLRRNLFICGANQGERKLVFDENCGATS